MYVLILATLPCEHAARRRDAAGEAGGQQVAASRGLPVEHFAGDEHAGSGAEHQVGIERLEKHGRPVSERLRATASGSGASAPAVPTPKIAGGSTISQQLAKNLLLSTERNLFRKGQELVLTKYLEIVLGKRRILEIYLNNVEWGEGVFGAEAAARYYFHKPASALTAREAARLAVMLPRPRYFEQNLDSGYLASRSGVIAAREGDVEIPR